VKTLKESNISYSEYLPKLSLEQSSRYRDCYYISRMNLE
jgi:hypothetical protein